MRWRILSNGRDGHLSEQNERDVICTLKCYKNWCHSMHVVRRWTVPPWPVQVAAGKMELQLAIIRMVVKRGPAGDRNLWSSQTLRETIMNCYPPTVYLLLTIEQHKPWDKSWSNCSSLGITIIVACFRPGCCGSGSAWRNQKARPEPCFDHYYVK